VRERRSVGSDQCVWTTGVGVVGEYDGMADHMRAT